MPDPVPQLRAKYSEEHRYANFGAALTGMRIEGFRGINGLNIEFDSPIIAFSGLNGAGKSTVGQLAVCTHRKPATAQQYKRYYVKDFFPSSVADPNPFSANARVQFRYQTDVTGSRQEVTVSRAIREWSGYKRQPERHCYYVGFSLYIPKIERKNFSIYRSTTLELRDVQNIPEEVREKFPKCLINLMR